MVKIVFVCLLRLMSYKSFLFTRITNRIKIIVFFAQLFLLIINSDEMPRIIELRSSSIEMRAQNENFMIKVSSRQFKTAKLDLPVYENPPSVQICRIHLFSWLVSHTNIYIVQ